MLRQRHLEKVEPIHNSLLMRKLRRNVAVENIYRFKLSNHEQNIRKNTQSPVGMMID